MWAVEIWRAAGIGGAVFLGTLALHLVWRRFVERHPHPGEAVGRWLHAHLALAIVGGGLALLVLVLSIARGVGARFNPLVHIRPAPPLVQAGAVAPPAFSLASALPVVLNQGQSEACGSFAVMEALYAERRYRKEEISDGAWSPWFDYAFAAGGQDVPTTLDQEAEAFIGHGVVPLSAQPSFGWPTQGEISLSLGAGGQYFYLYYSPAGAAGLTAIRGQIAAGHPVVLLIAVHNNFYTAFGSGSTDNGGAFTGLYHFVVAYRYQGDQFWVRNSWGTDFGQNGSIILTRTAMLNTVLAAGVVLPGAIAWPVPHPAPQPTRVPVAPATAIPRPTATPTGRPLPSGSSLIPLAVLPPTIRMRRDQALRQQPRTMAPRGRLVRRGWLVHTRGPQTPHWIAVQTLDHRASGWVWRRNARAP